MNFLFAFADSASEWSKKLLTVASPFALKRLKRIWQAHGALSILASDHKLSGPGDDGARGACGRHLCPAQPCPSGDLVVL